jgi:translation elongation factor EF-4
MIKMSFLYIEFIKDLFSSTLTRPNAAKELEETIFDIPYDEIIFDFSGVKSMSIEFAKEYRSIKYRTKKIIKEVKISPSIWSLIMNKVFQTT